MYSIPILSPEDLSHCEGYGLYPNIKPPIQMPVQPEANDDYGQHLSYWVDCSAVAECELVTSCTVYKGSYLSTEQPAFVCRRRKGGLLNNNRGCCEFYEGDVMAGKVRAAPKSARRSDSEYVLSRQEREVGRLLFPTYCSRIKYLPHFEVNSSCYIPKFIVVCLIALCVFLMMLCFAGYDKARDNFYGIAFKIVCSLLFASFVFLVFGLLTYLIAEPLEIYVITSLLDGQKMGTVRKKSAGRCKCYKNFHIALNRAIDQNQLMALVSLIFMDYYKGY